MEGASPQWAEFTSQARALLYTLTSCPAAGLPITSVRECTALFRAVYPKLYAALGTEPHALSLHHELLLEIHDTLADLTVPQDVLFGCILEFQVTAALVFTSPEEPLVLLHKHPKLPAFVLECQSLQHHTSDVPTELRPALNARAIACAATLLSLLAGPAPALSAPKATQVLWALAKLARLRPSLWPALLPGLCHLAGAPPPPALRPPSAQYALRSVLLLLLRLSATAPWRSSLVPAIEAVTRPLQGAGLLSAGQEESAALYLRLLAREEGAARKRLRAEVPAEDGMGKRPSPVPPRSGERELPPEGDSEVPAPTFRPISPRERPQTFRGPELPLEVPVDAFDDPSPVSGITASCDVGSPPSSWLGYAVDSLLATLATVDTGTLKDRHCASLHRILRRMAHAKD